MEEHGTSVNLSRSTNSSKENSEEYNKYKKEIDEILREESENGLAKTMSPDEHLIPNGSDITYSQFKNDLKKKNIEHKTSTLNVDTQELNIGVSQFVDTSKQLHTHNMQNKCPSMSRRYTPKSISYIKQILETSKRVIPFDVSDDEHDVVCVFDSSETRSGLNESVKEADKHENDSVVKSVIKQNNNFQHIENSTHLSSSSTSVISNSSRSNENKTYNKKRSASNKIGFAKRRSPRLQLNHSDVRDPVENGQVDKIQNQTICRTVAKGVESVKEPEKLKLLQAHDNLETNKNSKKCVDISEIEKNNACCENRQELVLKAQSSQTNNENFFSNKTSELSEICPRFCVKEVKTVNEQQSCINLVSSVPKCINDTPSQNKTISNKNIRTVKKCDIVSVLDSKSPGKINSKADSISNIDSRNSKSPRKDMKYKMLKHIFKLMLASPIKNTVTEFLDNDQEAQQLLKGWKLNMNVDMSKKYSKSTCDFCRSRESVSHQNNVNEECVNSNIRPTLCTKAVQTELSLISRNQFPSHSKWINESCSESDEDFDLNLLL